MVDIPQQNSIPPTREVEPWRIKAIAKCLREMYLYDHGFDPETGLKMDKCGASEPNVKFRTNDGGDISGKPENT